MSEGKWRHELLTKLSVTVITSSSLKCNLIQSGEVMSPKSRKSVSIFAHPVFEDLWLPQAGDTYTFVLWHKIHHYMSHNLIVCGSATVNMSLTCWMQSRPLWASLIWQKNIVLLPKPARSQKSMKLIHQEMSDSKVILKKVNKHRWQKNRIGKRSSALYGIALHSCTTRHVFGLAKKS